MYLNIYTICRILQLDCEANESFDCPAQKRK
eukprot:SAG11_NODE_24017_length_379_cov_0.903571_1_plen_30_part_01